MSEDREYTKIYRGQLCHASNGEEDELLGLLYQDGPHRYKVKILAEAVQDDMVGGCNFLSVRYYTSDKIIPADAPEMAFLASFYGNGEVDYSMAYSELTGYLWTDEKLKVGGHDLIAELTSHLGQFVHLEIKFSSVAITG